MITYQFGTRISAIVSSLMLATLVSNPAAAHCDSMSGPVVKDAQTALADENIDHVLKWAGEDDEAAIRDAFEMTLAVRGESDVAAATVVEGIQQRFADAYDKRQMADQSVEQGREYVQAYVEFTHFVVGLDHLVSSGPSHKHLETVAEVAK